MLPLFTTFILKSFLTEFVGIERATVSLTVPRSITELPPDCASAEAGTLRHKTISMKIPLRNLAGINWLLI